MVHLTQENSTGETNKQNMKHIEDSKKGDKI